MAWVAILYPPPASGKSSFCLILLSCMTSGVFFRCKLSLLKQHIFLILTQPSWDGYLLLYSPKSSIRGTGPKIANPKITKICGPQIANPQI
jgi:hypothetical protein